MARQSDIIVIAKVTSQNQFSPVAVANALAVSKTIKGKHPNNLTVFQVGSLGIDREALLETGKTYFLFLGKQSDDAPNTFYIKGGHEGLFLAEESGLHGVDHLVKSLHLKANQDPYQVLEAQVREALK